VSSSSSKEVRDQLLTKVSIITEHGKAFRKSIFIGFNEVNKNLERRQVSIICIANKSNEAAVHYLIEACLLQRIAFVILPHFSAQLKAALRVKQAFCFAVGKANQETAEEENDTIDAAVDELRDYLQALATSSLNNSK
jgi:ribosomal protein L7Ae-like RNA K-turn-binding protein